MQNTDSTPTLRYGLADSSPQKGHDWLLSAVDNVHAEDVVPCFQAFKTLVTIAGLRAAQHDFDQEECSANHKFMFDSIRR
eukprot:8275314-Lingulodinium_polyedra.AAC.1